MISQKGFFFTISIILFATTLVVFAQVYSSSIVGKEVRVLSNYSLISQSLLIDNVAINMEKIIDFDYNIDNDINSILISDSIPKTNFSQNIIDYESFLNNKFFPNSFGDKEIDFASIKDGNLELYFENDLNYIIDYSNKNNIFYHSSLNKIDLNVFVIDDLNYYEFSSETGSKNLVFYYEDSNSDNDFDFENNFSSALLNLVYFDQNVSIVFEEDYFMINNSDEKDIDFSTLLFFDNLPELMQVNINAFISYSLKNLDYYSLLKLNN
jgi:hypothetical protein